jgi:hypothetical protein
MEIKRIFLIPICLSFQTDLIENLAEFHASAEQIQAMQKIDEIESDDQRFPLLTEMDPFMIDQRLIIHQFFLFDDDEAYKGKRLESKGQFRVNNKYVPMFYSDFYFHSVLGFLFSSGIYIFVT